MIEDGICENLAWQNQVFLPLASAQGVRPKVNRRDGSNSLDSGHRRHGRNRHTADGRRVGEVCCSVGVEAGDRRCGRALELLALGEAHSGRGEAGAAREGKAASQEAAATSSDARAACPSGNRGSVAGGGSGRRAGMSG